jgi:hypothetical protein
MPLAWLEGKPIGTGKPGKLTKKLIAAYRDLVHDAIASGTTTSGCID